ncbi:MAG: ankyrin repeat domain-containing protein, partial [Thermoanaerobaculales bacterium]|nr:ankyrin repeat domain-containing protein [Thermoanaerobaculales bacterium]
MVKLFKIVAAGLAAIVLAYGIFTVGYRTSERFRARVAYGSDLDQADIGGWTALHRAAASGDVAMLEYLLAQGVDAEARTGRGETAWHIAGQHGRTEAAEFLAAQGVPTSEVEFPELAGPVLGQALPGEEPELFAPGIVSGHYPAHTPCVFHPSMTSVYWTAGRPPHGAVEMMRMGPPDFTWTRPELTDMMGEPSFSVDGRRLFFISRAPLRPGEPRDKENIWVKERTADGWSEPTPLGDAVNSKNPHFHHSVDSHGNLYFSDYNTLYYSEYRDGEYQEAVDLALHLQNNT